MYATYVPPVSPPPPSSIPILLLVYVYPSVPASHLALPFASPILLTLCNCETVLSCLLSYIIVYKINTKCNYKYMLRTQKESLFLTVRRVRG